MTVVKQPDIKNMGKTDEPHLRFLLSEALHIKVLEVLETIEQAVDPTQHSGLLSELVEELIREGMDYYFIKPQKLAVVGFLSINSTNLGITGFAKMSSPIIRKTFRGMDKDQLLTICGFIRELMD